MTCLRKTKQSITNNTQDKSSQVNRSTFFGTHKDEDVAAFPPGPLDVFGLFLVVLWAGHDPTKDSNLLFQLAGYIILTYTIQMDVVY